MSNHKRCGSCSTPTEPDDLTRAQDVESVMVLCDLCKGYQRFIVGLGEKICPKCNGSKQVNANATLRDYVQDREPMCPTCYSGAVQELGGKEDGDE